MDTFLLYFPTGTAGEFTRPETVVGSASVPRSGEFVRGGAEQVRLAPSFEVARRADLSAGVVVEWPYGGQRYIVTHVRYVDEGRAFLDAKNYGGEVRVLEVVTAGGEPVTAGGERVVA